MSAPSVAASNRGTDDTAAPYRSIDDVLADARRGLRRLEPEECFDAVVNAGAVIVDIRPQINRVAEGLVPVALIVERNVLEWRLDPTSDARLAIASRDLHVIVMCNEGYTSSLAAAALHELGVVRATDMMGGYRAWRVAGLPVAMPVITEGQP
jgi:rhodanese-related sulfurtransferase